MRTQCLPGIVLAKWMVVIVRRDIHVFTSVHVRFAFQYVSLHIPTILNCCCMMEIDTPTDQTMSLTFSVLAFYGCGIISLLSSFGQHTPILLSKIIK